VTIRIASLHQYPVKSSAPVNISRGWIDEWGLAGDRRYLVTNPDGLFLTGRKHPKLLSLQATPINGGLILAAEGKAPLKLIERDYPHLYTSATVWKSTFGAQFCGPEAEAWISDFLGEPAKLLFFGSLSSRPIEDVGDRQVSFADGYPLLLTNTASLDQLQTQCDGPIIMEQFRPNLVIEGAEAYAEDGWERIRIGDVVYRVHSPCTRCKLITLKPRSLEFHPKQEPLRNLIQHHSDEKKRPLFGQNLIAETEGLIEVGMDVEILD
jgi:uncharacterized protein YcbX